MDIQAVLTGVVVLGAIVFLLLKIKRKNGSCSSGCGCSPKEHEPEVKK